MKTAPLLRSVVLALVVLPCARGQSWMIDAPACVPAGGTIDVNLIASSGATQQAAAQYRLTWDPAVFQVDVGFGAMGAMFQNGWDGAANTMVPGEVYVSSWHLPVYPTGSSTVITVRLLHIGGFLPTALAGEVELWVDPMGADIMPGPFSMTGAMVAINCGPAPTCVITSPVGGASLMGSATITFNTTHPTMAPLNIAYSFNAGAGFMPASRVGGGSSMDTGVAPATGLTFAWDINADFAFPDTGVTFRVTVTDGVGGGNLCDVVVDVTPVNQSPTCVITSPLGGTTARTMATIIFDTADGDGHPLDIVYEFNSGGGFMPASRVGGGSSMDSGVLPATGLSFVWDIAADIPGAAAGTVFRITVDDLRFMGTSTCQVTVDVLPPNMPPSCSIIFPGAGATLMTSQGVLFSTADGNGDPLDIAYEFNSGGGFMPATRFGGGSSFDTGVPPSGALSFNWNIAADVPVSTMGVVFRISVDDLQGGTSSCNRTFNVSIMTGPNDPPNCLITSPAGGAALSGTALVTVNLTDPDFNRVDVTFEFSTGGPFQVATPVGGGTGMYLDVATPYTGYPFDWDIDADIAGFEPGTILRVTVDDQLGGVAQCQVVVDATGAGGGACLPPALCGDCNADTFISILDALAAAQIAVGVITPGAAQFDACNAQGSLTPSPLAVVDILDALVLAQSAAGIPVILTCCT